MPKLSKSELKNYCVILASRLRKNDVVFLHGNLGVGKTFAAACIIKAICGDIIKVQSPTFSIINEYPGKTPIYHLDLYRIKHQKDLQNLGLEELKENGIMLVEWPEIANDAGILNANYSIFLDFVNGNDLLREVRVAMAEESDLFFT